MAGMEIRVSVERDGRSWRATATVVDVTTVRRWGPSQIRAQEAAINSTLRRVYEIWEDGQLCINDVFPITLVSREP